MEWNFLFRVDFLKKVGEERKLKGVIFTEGEDPPTPQQIVSFLQDCGYSVKVEDADNLVFSDNHPVNPVRITIVKLGEDDSAPQDHVLKLLADQFRKVDPRI